MKAFGTEKGILGEWAPFCIEFDMASCFEV